MILNPYQERAVKIEGHCTVLACPGSGKTRVLSTRAGHLLKKYEHGRLCAVTFTRDAATELKERILDTCGQENANRVAIGTFHSLSMNQIRRNQQERLRLLGDGERLAVIRRCWKEVDSGLKLDEVVRAIDMVKARVNKPIFKNTAMQQIYDSYAQILNSENSMDFSDLLLHAVHGMNDGSISPFPVQWMLVDEAQDMDEVQMEWVLAHGRSGIQITLVGDDDQSLYSFRHALGYAGLEKVSKELGSTDLTLPINYRCAPNILNYAANLIKKNLNRADKNIQAGKSENGTIIVERFATPTEEGEYLSNVISENTNSWAVLGRTNVSLDPIEAALSVKEVPYKRLGSKSVWDKPIGNTLVGILRSITGEYWTGIANAMAFCKVDSTWINNLSKTSSGTSLERLKIALSREDLCNNKKKVTLAMLNGLSTWALQEEQGRTSLAIYGVAALLTGYCKPPEAVLLRSLTESLARLKGSMAQRLSFISQSKEKKIGDDVVQIMTLHASKGLEFDNVWIIGCSEGVLPHSDSSEEEERRLMYVGMTRAKSKLIISSSAESGVVSRFIEESGMSKN